MLENYKPPILYRIAILNEFRNTFACIDYKKFGITMSLGAWICESPHRGYQLSDDEIILFLNYEPIARFKSKDEAAKGLKSLLEDAPGDVIAEQDYLFRAL